MQVLGYNAAGGKVIAGDLFNYSLTPCCEAAVSGSDRPRCKACGKPARDDADVVTVAVCRQCGEFSDSTYWTAKCEAA